MRHLYQGESSMTLIWYFKFKKSVPSKQIKADYSQSCTTLKHSSYILYNSSWKTHSSVGTEQKDLLKFHMKL